MDRLARQEARLKRIEDQLVRSSQETRKLERQIQRLNQTKTLSEAHQSRTPV